MCKSAIVASLLLVPFLGMAQQVRMPDLLSYLNTSVPEFDRCMFKQGFVCYKSQGDLLSWTCLFAYQPTPYPAAPAQATALIQYVRNPRTDLVIYQVRSKGQYELLVKEMTDMGFKMEPVPTDRCTFIRDNTVITCRLTDNLNGISGNYSGHTITLARRRY